MGKLLDAYSIKLKDEGYKKGDIYEILEEEAKKLCEELETDNAGQPKAKTASEYLAFFKQGIGSISVKNAPKVGGSYFVTV